DGATASPLRATGLERIQDHRSLLDRRPGVCTVCTHHSQTALGKARAQLRAVQNKEDKRASGQVRMMELKGKKVLVVGLGKSGLAAALFLRHKGAQVTVSDVRSAEELAKDIPALLEEGIMVEAGGHGLLTFRRQDLIVVSPGVPLDTPEL